MSIVMEEEIKRWPALRTVDGPCLKPLLLCPFRFLRSVVAVKPTPPIAASQYPPARLRARCLH